MLSEYKGPANSESMLSCMVGERIVGAVLEGHCLVLLVESGVALEVTSLGGETRPAFAVMSQRDTKALIRNRLERLSALRWQIEEAQALLVEVSDGD